MTSPELRTLLKSALDARRHHDRPEAGRRFSQLLATARAAGCPEAALAAEAHRALLDGDCAAAERALSALVGVAPEAPEASALGMLLAEQWPAPVRACERHLVGSSGSFRRLCRKLPRAGEITLELGASHGLASRMLARRSGRVYAVEKSAEMARRAREATADLPNVHVVHADVRDPGLVRAHVPRADLVFLDIGGSTPVRQVLQAAFIYEGLYRPRAMVIRSVHLNEFVAGLTTFEPRPA